MSRSELLNAILQLPPEDRRELVYSAWKSLDDLDQTGPDNEVLETSAFAEDVERRLDAATQDRSLLCDGDEVLREARQLVGQK